MVCALCGISRHCPPISSLDHRHAPPLCPKTHVTPPAIPNIHGAVDSAVADHDSVGMDERGAKRLGSVLRMLREDRELTQAVLVARAGISTNQLQNIEAGKASGLKDATDPSNPRLSTLIDICDVLNVVPSEVMARSGY